MVRIAIQGQDEQNPIREGGDGSGRKGVETGRIWKFYRVEQRAKRGAQNPPPMVPLLGLEPGPLTLASAHSAARPYPLAADLPSTATSFPREDFPNSPGPL